MATAKVKHVLSTSNISQSHLPGIVPGSHLFNCIFNGLVKNKNGKSFPKFTAKKYKLIYKTMLELLQTVMEDPYYSPRLVQQLYAWAEAGCHILHHQWGDIIVWVEAVIMTEMIAEEAEARAEGTEASLGF
ncbi:hypothetical protein EV424DRAFT_1342900 [Suillus variegatus]|nr:hypothetical protein EV424DRAFT_1342900 [Suillus variegatus]